jgi:hypothetical protein
LGSVIAEVIALGESAPIGDKVDIWRDIDRVGAGAVGDGEAVAAGLRGMRALCSSERDAIGCREPTWLENIEFRGKKALKCENIEQKYSQI